MEYKETLNLPQTTLEMRANATNKEPQTQKFWEDIKVYEKNLLDAIVCNGCAAGIMCPADVGRSSARGDYGSCRTA